jgi:hypothetical protein
MRNDHCLRLKQVGIIVLLGASAASSSRALCYGTPRSAVDALLTRSSFSAEVGNDGYQVTRIESDPVLGEKWAMVSRCGHPDWPVLAVPANKASSLTATPATEGVRTASVVHAGDIVRLWRQESIVRFEVSGVAEESGGLGSTIRVRLVHKNTDDQSPPEEFSGVIRGQSNVEILQ